MKENAVPDPRPCDKDTGIGRVARDKPVIA